MAGGDPKEVRNQAYYEFLRGHPLVQHLLGKLWHCTSLANYQSILTTGTLMPNDGTRVGVMKRRGPNLTVCEKLGAISLFDFDLPRDQIFPLTSATESIDEYFLEWGKFLWWYDPITIILVPARRHIASRLKVYEDCKSVGGQWIYNVEVCHQGPIPLTAIAETIVVGDASRHTHQFYPFVRHPDPQRVNGLLDEWFSNPDESQVP